MAARPGPVEGVIFDFGGVISAPLFDDLERFEQAQGYPPGSVGRLMFGESMNHLAAGGGDPVDGAFDDGDGPIHDFHLLEMGRLSLADYMRGLEARAHDILGRPLDFGAYTEYSRAMPLLIQWPVVHEIQRLRGENVRLALLTNNVKEFGSSWRATFHVDELFPVVVDSSEVGMRKPDPRIYELTCELIDVAPTSAVFLDDNADNVAAAAALGIETVHVGRDPLRTIEELRAILDRRGVLASRA